MGKLLVKPKKCSMCLWRDRLLTKTLIFVNKLCVRALNQQQAGAPLSLVKLIKPPRRGRQGADHYLNSQGLTTSLCTKQATIQKRRLTSSKDMRRFATREGYSKTPRWMTQCC
jgi:hypothetical protein